jgi:protein-S-isoprenylcysteine O-methyltransferase Ste14
MTGANLLVPPVFFALGLVVMAGLHRFVAVITVIPESLGWLAAVPVLLSMLVGVPAILEFRRNRTSVHPHHQPSALVTGGPYRFTRNPMYLALTLLLVGVAIRLGTLTPFVVVPTFMLVIQRRFVVSEERRLAELFGPAFDEYRRRVRRWL